VQKKGHKEGRTKPIEIEMTKGRPSRRPKRGSPPTVKLSQPGNAHQDGVEGVEQLAEARPAVFGKRQVSSLKT